MHHLNSSGATLLFTQKALLKNAVRAASEAGIPRERIILIGEEREVGFGHFSGLLDVEPKGKRTKLVPDEDLSFLVYSSGTTGLPKGVMLTHLNVVSDMFMLNSSEGSIFSWDNDKILAVLPFYHIYGMITYSAVDFQLLRLLIACRTTMLNAFPSIQWNYHYSYDRLQLQGLLPNHPRTQNHLHICRTTDRRSSRQEFYRLRV